jgi:hypothetical protein
MRTLGLVALMVVAGCSSQPAASATSPTPSVSAQAACKLPVYWGENVTSPPGIRTHAAFVSWPGGAVTDVGIVPPYPLVSGSAYDAGSNKWLPVSRELVSPDGTRYAYSSGVQTHYEVHVVDIASGADRMLYSGPTDFFVLAFESDAIYVVNAIAPRQGVFEKLYRLDPAGGSPALVPGSDRHLYQWGWVLVSDGAAWGIDVPIQGSGYSVLRLDLATNQVTDWLDGQATMFWPIGTDKMHRLYLANNQQQLWRIGSPGQVDRLANPGPVTPSAGLGAPSGFVSDSHGVWISGQGGVWLYSVPGEPIQVQVGPLDANVWLGGPCA